MTYALRSAPAQKRRPAPVTTATLVSEALSEYQVDEMRDKLGLRHWNSAKVGDVLTIAEARPQTSLGRASNHLTLSASWH